MMEKQYTLYGDGIHDDYPAIQEMLDSGSCQVELPAPAVRYQISKTLVISSGCKLKLPRFAHIRLMALLSLAYVFIHSLGCFNHTV